MKLIVKTERGDKAALEEFVTVRGRISMDNIDYCHEHSMVDITLNGKKVKERTTTKIITHSGNTILLDMKLDDFEKIEAEWWEMAEKANEEE